MSQDEMSTELPEVRAYTVGGRLRAEREARGIAIDDVAQTLKVTRKVLHSIEHDDWNALPGYTFARGVVRGYARYLRLDPEALLREMKAGAMPQPPSLDLPESTRAALPVPGQTEGRDRLAAIAGVLVVAAAVTTYFLVPDEWFGSPHGAPTAARVPEAVLPVPAASPQPVVNAAPAMGLPASSVLPSAVPATTEPVKPSVVETPTLFFRFSERSWVEVRDRSGQIVLSGEVGAGAERTVGGQPPFNIALGYADGVALTYRGQPVDLKLHTNPQRVARLTLE